ncbi:MAG: cysteine-rich CWC family protein [Bacteroidetes bacterium]|nr:cysteine-rich CWC family protein [Bacteroidia bacterium]MBN8695190.1 cysteine-rich CWC family protein [Bacteroidota bacterium]
MTTKKCSKCGQDFQCSNEKMGCWCEDLYLDIQTLNELKKEYDNCLCPTCLKEYSERKPKK